MGKVESGRSNQTSRADQSQRSEEQSPQEKAAQTARSTDNKAKVRENSDGSLDIKSDRADEVEAALKSDPSATVTRSADGSLHVTFAQPVEETGDDLGVSEAGGADGSSGGGCGGSDGSGSSEAATSAGSNAAANVSSQDLALLAQLLGYSSVEELLNALKNKPEEIQEKLAGIKNAEQKAKATDLVNQATTGDGYQAQPIGQNSQLLQTSDVVSASPGSPPAIPGVDATSLSSLNRYQGGMVTA